VRLVNLPGVSGLGDLRVHLRHPLPREASFTPRIRQQVYLIFFRDTAQYLTYGRGGGG
jgi:hypothetical protein